MINHTKQMILLVDNQDRMHLVLVHNLLNLCNFRICQNAFRLTRHDVFYRMLHEARLPALHSTTDVAIGNQADNLLVFIERDAKSQFTFASSRLASS